MEQIVTWQFFCGLNKDDRKPQKATNYYVKGQVQTNLIKIKQV